MESWALTLVVLRPPERHPLWRRQKVLAESVWFSWVGVVGVADVLVSRVALVLVVRVPV